MAVRQSLSLYQFGTVFACLRPLLQVHQSSSLPNTLKAYMNLNFWVSLDTLFTLVVSIVALASGHAISIAPYVVTVLATAIVIFLIAFETLSYHTCLQIWKNMITAEHSISSKGGDPWCLALKIRTHGPDGEWILRLQSFNTNPWDLGPRENLRQLLGPWWQWPLFWIQPERVSRYGNYAGWDLPFGTEVLKARDAFIGFTGVTIDAPVPSTSQAEGSTRRRQNRSSAALRRMQARSSGSSTSHVDSTTSS